MIEVMASGLGFQPMWEVSLATPARLTAQTVSTLVEVEMSSYADIGLGWHEVKVNLSAAVASLGFTPESVTARILSPDEDLDSHVADWVVADARAPGSFDPQVYSETRTTASCEEEDHTFLSFWHEFCERGEYKVSLAFEFDSGRTVTSNKAILIRAADGLYESI